MESEFKSRRRGPQRSHVVPFGRFHPLLSSLMTIGDREKWSVNASCQKGGGIVEVAPGFVLVFVQEKT